MKHSFFDKQKKHMEASIWSHITSILQVIYEAWQRVRSYIWKHWKRMKYYLYQALSFTMHIIHMQLLLLGDVSHPA